MKLNIWIVVSGVVLILLLIGILIFQKGDRSAERTNTFDPSFEMIDPKNPTTMVDNILRLKKENDRLIYEKCLIEQIKPFVDNKIGTYAKGVNIPKSFYDGMGRLNPSAMSFLDGNSVSNVFDFGFESADNCNSNQQNNEFYYTTTFVYKVYDNIRKLYNQQLREILDQTNLPVRYSYYKPPGLFSSSDDFDNLTISKISSFNRVQEKIDTLKYDRTLIEQIPIIAKVRLDTLSRRLEARAAVADDLIKKNKEEYVKFIDQYTNSRLDINDKAIKYGIIAFCFTALAMYITGLFSRNKLRQLGTDVNPNFSEDFKASMWNSVYLITVLLLIITIFILGLARLLGENSLAALLGSIAGYVLNNRLSENKNTVANGSSGDMGTNKGK